jgi:hypothetical protein
MHLEGIVQISRLGSVGSTVQADTCFFVLTVGSDEDELKALF